MLNASRDSATINEGIGRYSVTWNLEFRISRIGRNRAEVLFQDRKSSLLYKLQRDC